jgi:hypothetical protein
MEDEILSRLQNKRQRTDDAPWSPTMATSGHRPPGESFNDKKYRKFLAAFIIETNSTFRIVESTGFNNNLIQYCNAKAEPISRHTILQDIRNLHKELQPMIKAKLAAHTTARWHVSLILDTWTSGSKVPYLLLPRIG